MSEDFSKDDLLLAYLDTEVTMRGHEGETVRVMRPGAGGSAMSLPVYLEYLFVDAWVLTAFNPLSRVLSPAENAARMKELAQDVLRHDWLFDEAVGSSPDDVWSEDSFVIWGRTQEESDELAVELPQLAIKYGQNCIMRLVDSRKILVPGVDPFFSGETSYTLKITG
jgi:hypothetical protein